MTADVKPSLRMLHLELDAPSLARFARLEHLPLDRVDTGYLVHHGLRALFGDLGPQPFAVDPGMAPGVSGDRRIVVLGYGQHGVAALRAHADAFAAPAIHAACAWERAADKALPVFPSGTVVDVAVRVCPTVRAAKAMVVNRVDVGRRSCRAGDEIDAFVARCAAVDPDGRGDAQLDRAEVYGDWLRAQLERHGGARLVGQSRMTAYHLERRFRRTQAGDGGERQGRAPVLPDAVLAGRLEVSDSAAFTALLARGIGRHRAFGYGMVLLRPARS